MIAQSPMTRDKPLCGIGMQYYLEEAAWHLIFHFAALVNQDASAKYKVQIIQLNSL